MCRASCSDRRLRTHEDGIVMSMIGTLNFHNLITTCMSPSQAQCIHRCFRPGVAETDLLNRSKAAHHLFCQENGIGARQRIQAPFAKLVSQSLYQNWMGVTYK